jgi:hypothetical protein
MSGLQIEIGDTIYIHGEATRVCSNRAMGNAKWYFASKGRQGMIRRDLAQQMMDEGSAKFYQSLVLIPSTPEYQPTAGE